MMALGYVHAQDRLWQMELMPYRAWKIIWNFGSVALKNDKFLQDCRRSLNKGHCCKKVKAIN
jgi:hypothetical protein